MIRIPEGILVLERGPNFVVLTGYGTELTFVRDFTRGVFCKRRVGPWAGKSSFLEMREIAQRIMNESQKAQIYARGDYAIR